MYRYEFQQQLKELVDKTRTLSPIVARRKANAFLAHTNDIIMYKSNQVDEVYAELKQKNKLIQVLKTGWIEWDKGRMRVSEIIKIDAAEVNIVCYTKDGKYTCFKKESFAYLLDLI